MSSAIVAALAGALTFPARAPAQPSLRAGDLTVEVEAEPFAIVFRDRADGEILRTSQSGLEPTDTVARYGPPGYAFDRRVPVVNNAYFGYYVPAEAPTLWFHARRLLDSRRRPGRLDLLAATDDPLGHRLQLRLVRRADGVITMRSRIAPDSGPLADLASVSGVAFEADSEERFLGFGERSNAVDQTGNRVINWAEEGPFSSGLAEPLLRPTIPEFTFPTGPTTTNLPIPWALSTRGVGVLIDQPERSSFRLRREREHSWHAEAEADRLRATVFAGPRPRDALRRYADFTGRQPEPARWIFGPWFQPTLESRDYELADRFRREDVPVTVAQTYRHYLPCGDHVGRRPDERERVREYHRRGYRITTYVNPHVCTHYQPVYDEAAARGYFVENDRGEPYVLTNPFTADQLVSEIDFTNPAAEDYWQDLLREPIADGYDGWMEDFGEYTPTDARLDNGRDGLSMHNRYPVLYHRASHRLTRKEMGSAATFVRSGFHGVQPYARVVWGGDPTEDWSCSDGLCAAVHQGLSIGLSGVAYWGSDIGGFHAVANPRTDAELNIRWLQLGAVSGVMRTQANGYSFVSPRSRRSQVWHPEVMPIWRRYASLRTQLEPYITAASERYQRTGLPLMRHHLLTDAGDRNAVRRQDQFMFGPDLLAAPVIEPDARQRTLYLPRGDWIDLWRSARYRTADGSLRLTGARELRGKRTVTLPAPLDQLPLLVRAGALIPLLSPDVETLANIDSARDVVSAADRRDRMQLLAFPDGRSAAALPDGERLRSRVDGSGWRLELETRRERRYDIQAALPPGAPPCRIVADGNRLAPSRWRFDPRARVLRLRLRMGAGALLARDCD